jgi:cytochrome c oxidase subunit 4
MTAHAATAEHAHPTPGVYLRIALILFVLTALEVSGFEVARRGAPAALASIVAPIITEILIVLSAAKFALVAMFYMHLKQDSRLFSTLFVFPILIATVIIIALLTLFSYLHQLHPLLK